MNRILLKNCCCIKPSAGTPSLRNQDILIEDAVIVRIAPYQQADEATRVVDCSSHVVVPGFVNTHHHFFQTLTRNLPDVQNAELFPWLRYLYEVWKYVDDEAVYVSSLLAMAELLKTGCTCSTDHLYLYPEGTSGDFASHQFRAAEEIGMRFSPTRGSMSLSKKDGGLPPDSVVQDEDIILADCERVIDQFHDPAPMAMRKVVLAPCSPFSVTEELMKQSARLARKRGVRLHTHLAETADEDAYCMKKFGIRPLELMERCEFIGDDVFYAHGIHFTDSELDILEKTGTQIAHCPSSNMRLGSGICRVREMIDRGITVSLAVDGSASNDTSDYLGEMRQALLLQRVRYGSGGLNADEVLKMATDNGAQVLGFSQVGRVEPGYAADLAIFDMDKLEYSGSRSDPFASLIFCGFNHASDYTICNGRIVVDQGKLTGIDEEKLKADANRIAAGLIDHA
ncbi:MAG: 8-oxoguanine deaminase [Spirochaetales bacterium]|jgi:8-oxoguanine deaminase|nr:8-oxoguanine deaminase [Spirochaetales bacterium]